MKKTQLNKEKLLLKKLKIAQLTTDQLIGLNGGTMMMTKSLTRGSIIQVPTRPDDTKDCPRLNIPIK